MDQSGQYLIAVDLGRLQMISKLCTKRCALDNVGSIREVDCEISHRLERGMKGTETMRLALINALERATFLPTKCVLKP